MLKIKHLYLVLFFFQIPTLLCAQKLKYKELYPILNSDTITFTIAKQLLYDYIKEEPNFANAYYQFANICRKHIKELDVLTETKLILKYCDIAITNYTMFLNMTNDKDLKFYKEYYPELVKSNNNNKQEVNYIETTKLIKQIIAELTDYSSKINNISYLFNKSNDFYEKSRYQYLNINNKYVSENDIYLLADETFINECNELIQSYDSTVFYINTYSNAIKTFSIGKYQQHFNFKKIETYRLDGFDTQTSFLFNEITIWDYGFWAKKTLKIINTDIKELRIKIDNTEKELSEGIKILRDTTQNYSLPSEYRFNKNTLLKLQKFDFNSLVINLFYFQKAQLDWLLLMRNNIKIDSTIYSLDENLLLNGKLLKSLYLTDSLLENLQITLTDKNFGKYQNFIITFFGSKSNFYKYLELNKKEISDNLESLNNKSFQLFTSDYIDSIANLIYKGNQISLYSIKRESQYTTLSLQKDINSNYFLAGYYKKYIKDTSNVAFILKSNKDKINWFKSIEFPNCNTYSNFIEIKHRDIISIMLVKCNTDNTLSNYILKFDLNGKEKTKNKLNIYDSIIGFASDSLGNNHLVITTTKADSIRFYYLNNEGDISWEKLFQWKGNISHVFIFKESVFFFGTYNFLKIGDTPYTTDYNDIKSTAFVLQIDKKGNNTYFLPLKLDEPVNILSVKIYDNNNIHIFAQKKSLLKDDAKVLPTEKELIHYIINSKMTILYSNQRN